MVQGLNVAMQGWLLLICFSSMAMAPATTWSLYKQDICWSLPSLLWRLLWDWQRVHEFLSYYEFLSHLTYQHAQWNLHLSNLAPMTLEGCKIVRVCILLWHCQYMLARDNNRTQAICLKGLFVKSHFKAHALYYSDVEEKGYPSAAWWDINAWWIPSSACDKNRVVRLQNSLHWFDLPRHKTCVGLDCIMMFVQFTTQVWMAGCSQGELIHLKDCSLNVGRKLSVKSHRGIVHDVVR